MIEDLRNGPCIVLMWVLGGLFPTKQAAHHVVRKLMDLGLVECVGEVSFEGTGQKHHVFIATGTPYKANQLKHDVILMLVQKRLGVTLLRGRLADRKRIPDGTLPVPGNPIHVEVHTGSMGYQEVLEKRYPKYEDSKDWVMWVCCGLWSKHAETEREGMRLRSASIAHCAWFCTLGDLLLHGWDTPLVNYEDREARLTELLTVRPDESVPETAESSGNSGEEAAENTQGSTEQ